MRNKLRISEGKNPINTGDWGSQVMGNMDESFGELLRVHLGKNQASPKLSTINILSAFSILLNTNPLLVLTNHQNPELAMPVHSTTTSSSILTCQC